jgi:hypothetical protein
VDERWPQESDDLLRRDNAQKNKRKTERKAERKQTTSGSRTSPQSAEPSRLGGESKPRMNGPATDPALEI